MDQFLVKRSWGWQVTTSTFHPVSLSIAIWAIILTLVVFKIASDYYSSIERKIIKQQTKWVLLAASVTVVGALLSEVLFRSLKIDLPPVTSIGFGITCILLAFSMLKFRLFLINPEVAARNILSQMTDAVFLLDLDGKIRSVNTAALDLLNYSEIELIGKNVLSIVVDRNENIHAISDLIDIDHLTQHLEYEVDFLRKDGQIIPVSISNSFVKSTHGSELRGMVWVSRDITKQKQIEEERQKSESIRKELEEKRLGFITMTSHELRTPLTAILGYTEFLEKTLHNDLNKEIFTKQLGIIKKNALRLDRLTRGMIDLNQINEQKFRIKKEEVNFLEFLDDSLSIYETKLKEKFVTNLPSGTTPIMIMMDSDRINQVLVNVIDNAIKNSTLEQLFITVQLEVEQKSIDLCITDHGPGIKSEDLEAIFEKFVSIPTKNSVIGSGIGLHVSRMIVKAHGGIMYAESAGLDKGATFHISLPR
jgi:PAS domain S-box-containing protein